jgi:hypothetical protein
MRDDICHRLQRFDGRRPSVTMQNAGYAAHCEYSISSRYGIN